MYRRHASVEGADVPASGRLPLTQIAASALRGFPCRELEAQYLQHLDRSAVKAWLMRLLTFVALVHTFLLCRNAGWADPLALSTTLPMVVLGATVVKRFETRGWAVVAVVLFFHQCFYCLLVLLDLTALTPLAMNVMLLGTCTAP